jgi:adenylate cyclase
VTDAAAGADPAGPADPAVPADPAGPAASAEDLGEVLDLIEEFLLDGRPRLTREEVAAAAGVPLDVAMELWRLSGFPHAQAGEVAFTDADVTALRLTHELMELGVLSPDRQAALVRTWGRSFARLAEWQTSLLADVARERGDEGSDPGEDLVQLAGEVLPRVEALQSYIWRRHLGSAASRQLGMIGTGRTAVPLAVGFVDIVGYTSRSKELSESELVDWVERFEDGMSELIASVPDGRVIKSLGDAVLFVAPSVAAGVAVALGAVALGEAAESSFPRVRAGVAYGEVVLRLGDVFGPTVNIASRLTSIARPGTVLCDEGAADELRDEPDVHLRRLRRTSVKGYSRLQPYVVRPGSGTSSGSPGRDLPVTEE